MAELFGKWISGLDRTRKVAFGRISNFLGATEINADAWEDLEAMLIQADLGIDVTEEIISSLQAQVDENGLTKTSELRDYLEADLQSRLSDRPVLDFSDPHARCDPPCWREWLRQDHHDRKTG